MIPYATVGGAVLYVGDCREVLAGLEEGFADSVVCDPPYDLTSGSDLQRDRARGAARRGFMGLAWDGTGVAFDPDTWRAAYRALKPGGHLLAFGGTRTYHRMACAIEDAGFEIRDQMQWIYGSGFPKSLDVSKAIDKRRDDGNQILAVTRFVSAAADAIGVSRSAIDAHMGTSDMAGWWTSNLRHRCQCPRWDQWLRLKELLCFGDQMDAEVWRLNERKGTPGEAWATAPVLATDHRMNEPSGIVNIGQGERTAVVREIKDPATDAAREWDGWGTALKPAHEPICVARKPLRGTVAANVLEHGTGALNVEGCRIESPDGPVVRMEHRTTAARRGYGGGLKGGARVEPHNAGRWPANVILGCACEEEHEPGCAVRLMDELSGACGASAPVRGTEPSGLTRNAYSPRERVPGAFHGDAGGASRFFYCAKASRAERTANGAVPNSHATVKPLALIEYLIRLVTPPGGMMLDLTAGSGTGGVACLRGGWRHVAIELLPQHAEIIVGRWREAAGPLFASEVSG